MLELHNAIREANNEILDNTSISYPPGAELSENEIAAIKKLKLSDDQRAALKKIILNATSYPTFHLLSLLDGVVDPVYGDIENWQGLTLSKKKVGDDEMLHDLFYESFHDYTPS